ncbi:MAG: fibronectin type III domain-containing protein [Verrucomicrobia bacterium]|nr:fibronectin type III domain-containing protein [Verrucomicrobiota bacterium]
MKNTITSSPLKLIPQITSAIPGVLKYGAVLGLPANMGTSMQAKKGALIASDGSYEQARLDLRNATAARRLAIRKVRNHIRAVRELVKPSLTPKYSQAWEAFGFVGSLQVTTRVSNLLMTLTKMGSHLAANPDLGADDPNLVATKTRDLETMLMTANTVVNQKKGTLQRLLEARAAKAEEVRYILRELSSALRLKLDPLDSRWVEFGFNKVGARPTPDAPTGVTAVLLGTNAISIRWPATPRAEHYRGWKRVVGVDAEMVFVGSTSDLDMLMEELPSDSEVEVALSAVNNGGESVRSTVLVVRTFSGESQK